MPNKDYYDILGVSKNASEEEIKNAFRRLANKYHPDKGGGPESEAKFKEINEAYQVLSDRQKRSTYDQFGSAEPSAAGFDFRQAGFDFSSGFGFSGGLGDIFEGIFGQAMSQVQAEINVSIPQAVLGDTLHFQIDNRSVSLTIPPGTQNGQTFRLKGQGRSFRGGVGDLILIVKINIPRRISREERDLYSRLKDLTA